MADKEIGTLTAASALDGTELIHAVQSSNSRKATAAQIQDFVLTSVDQDVTPDADGTRDLGASGNAWAQVWADNYGDGSGASIPSEYVTGGSAKVWCNFSSVGTLTIRDSLNVSSVTDVGVGKSIVNFSSAFGSIGYSPQIGVRKNDANDDGNMSVIFGCTGTTYTVSAISITCSYNVISTQHDTDLLAPIITGDLA